MRAVHHVEPFTTTDSAWGIHCLTCGFEVHGLSCIEAAEDAATAHVHAEIIDQRDRAIRWAVRLEGELAEAEAEASRWRRIAETAATAETERLAAEHASRGCDICTDKIGTEVTPAGAS